MSDRPRDIWTRLAIDPIADPLARALAPHRWVTPNRITSSAGVVGLAAAGLLASGHLRLGGAMFLLRFFADCLDGKVARLQGSGSESGALLDIATDVICVSSAYAGLTYWAVRTDRVDPAVAIALVTAVGCYGWALAHRKHLAERAGLGEGGSGLSRRTDLPLLDPWLRLCRRLGMSPVPWAVEAETVALGLAPLLGPGSAVVGLWVALAFYLVASLVNLRRNWRIATRLDQLARTHPRSVS